MSSGIAKSVSAVKDLFTKPIFFSKEDADKRRAAWLKEEQKLRNERKGYKKSSDQYESITKKIRDIDRKVGYAFDYSQRKKVSKTGSCMVCATCMKPIAR